jgi:peptidoglycan/LPS O-acetylase OafA/YrhL
MTIRRTTLALCCGVVLAAVGALVVGQDVSGRYSYEAYDNLVGGAGIVAALCAALAMQRRGWARLPLLAAVGVSALMAYARFSTPGPDDIDLTPLFLPPVIIVAGLTALMLTASSVEPDRTMSRFVEPDEASGRQFVRDDEHGA